MIEVIAEILSNEIDNQDYHITYSALANSIGVSNYTLCRLFKEKNEPDLSVIISAVRFLNPEKEYEIMANVCVNVNRPKNIKIAMEYACLHRQFKLLSDLIVKCEGGSREISEWGILHSILFDYHLRRKTLDELLSVLDNNTFKNKESIILAKLIHSMILYRKSHYSYMFDIVRSVEKILEVVKDSTLRSCLQLRTFELLSNGYLYVKNDPKKARFYANSLISLNMCPPIKIRAYHIIGTSFLFDNHSQAIKNYIKFKEMAKEFKRSDVVREADEQSIFFANTLWGIDLEESYTSDVVESAHYEAKWGDKEKAKEILKDNNVNCAYSTCYLGLANDNPDLLLKSIKMFQEQGNLFMANMPIRYLKKYSSYYTVIKNLYNIA